MLALSLLTVGTHTCPSRCTDNVPRSAFDSEIIQLPTPLPLDQSHAPDAVEPIGEHTYVVHGLLSPAESDAVIAAAEATGAFEPETIEFGLGRGHSSRDVLRFEDRALTATLARRLQGLLPELVGRNKTRLQGTVWRPAGLNSMLRLARYRPGDQLPVHNDHVTRAGRRCASAWTLTIYLSTLATTDGGAISFPPVSRYDRLCSMLGLTPDRSIRVPNLQPRAGSGLLLAHDVLHEAETLTRPAGRKYILRTEPLYWSGADASSGLPPHEVEPRWPPGAVDASGRRLSHRGGTLVPASTPQAQAQAQACALEHVVASEWECPDCS